MREYCLRLQSLVKDGASNEKLQTEKSAMMGQVSFFYLNPKWFSNIIKIGCFVVSLYIIFF